MIISLRFKVPEDFGENKFRLLLDCYLCDDCDVGELLRCGNPSHKACSVDVCS